MFDIHRNLIWVLIYLAFTLGSYAFLHQAINKLEPATAEARQSLLKTVYVASPAIITGGRNIAFETSDAISNAPASYLNLLDCCESDDAIASRIVIGQTRCRIIRNERE